MIDLGLIQSVERLLGQNWGFPGREEILPIDPVSVRAQEFQPDLSDVIDSLP